jgi:adenylate kinase family enzyme
MKRLSFIIVVGKPGAGKSSIGSVLARHLESTYISLGSFMRDTLNIPDPHIGVDKDVVYEQLHQHFSSQDGNHLIILDCHPYPEEDFDALQAFLAHPKVQLETVVHVDAHDHIALKRLERRPRPGQSYSDRLKYYNDNAHFIEKLMVHPRAIRIENNVDFNDTQTLEAFDSIIAQILDDLKQNV